MSARSAPRGRGFVAGALTAVADWLVEPASEPAEIRDEPLAPPARPVVAVAGLHRGSGVTTVARALGTALAAGDPSRACLVASDEGGGQGIALGSPAAGRLARAVASLVDGRVRACGRLCLVEGGDSGTLCAASRDLAPVVLDVSDPAGAAAAASLADHVLLVAGPEADPSLAAVVAESLEGVGPRPIVLLNRADSAAAQWAAENPVRVPASRLAAQLAFAGREPRGPMGEVVAELADGLRVSGSSPFSNS